MTLLILFANPLSSLLGATAQLGYVLCLVSVTLPVGALGIGSRALLSRQSEFRYIATTELVSHALASFVVAIPLAVAGYGVWALACAAVAQAVTSLVLLARRAAPKLSHRAPDFDSWHSRRQGLASHVSDSGAVGRADFVGAGPE